MHRLILEYIIYKLLAEDFVGLKKSFFNAPNSKVEVLINKLKKKEPIDLTNGEKAVIDTVTVNDESFTEENFDDLKSALSDLSASDKITFKSGDKSYKISALARTKDLGGKGKGGGLQPERKAIASLQEQLNQIGKPITLSIGGESYPGIDGVVNVKENQKADFAFTSGGDPKVFISYKPGNSPANILLYGGITKVADLDEVQEFISAVKEKTWSMEGAKADFGAPVTDPEVIQKTLFGYNSGGEYGENNVQAIVQGTNLQIVEEGDSYTLKAALIITPDDVPTSGGYTPYYNARFANDRSQYGVKYCRFTVTPLGSRKMKMLNLDAEA